LGDKIYTWLEFGLARYGNLSTDSRGIGGFYWTCIGLQCLSTAVLAALGVLSTEEVMECEQHSKARKANNIAELTWSRYVVTRYGMETWVLFCKLSGSFYLMPSSKPVDFQVFTNPCKRMLLTSLLVEEAEYLACHVLPSSLLMIHYARRGCEDDVAELTRR